MYILSLWFSVVSDPPDKYSCVVHICTEDDDDTGGIGINTNADVRQCATEVENVFQDWKRVIIRLLRCSGLRPIPTSMCDWLEEAGNLVDQSIQYTSLDSRMNNITAAEFDRKYFPLIYGAQGNCPEEEKIHITWNSVSLLTLVFYCTICKVIL